MIVQPGRQPLRLASPTLLFAEMTTTTTTTCVVLITLPFSVAAAVAVAVASEDPFSENFAKRTLLPLCVFGRRVASRRAHLVAFRDVTRRKETMCLAVLRCARAMKISTAEFAEGQGEN